MTSIGFATLQIIPSLDGVSKSVQKQLGALDGKKFGKEFGKDIAKGVQASERDVKKAFEGHAKLADRAADATGKLKVAQAGYQDLLDKGIKSGQRYERAKQQVEKATRDEVRATRSATDALKDYEKAQKRAADGVDNIGSGLGAKLKSLAGDAASGGSEAAAGFVEGFGGPIAAVGTKAGPIGLALAAAAALGVGAGALIAKQVMAGMERELNADRIQAQLGLSDAEAKRFGESAGRVYGGAFGESLGDVQQAASDVASTLGTTGGPVLEDLTAKALTFRDVFGTDVPESIALAQNMIVNGLAPDASAAFDLITTGFQKFPAAMRDELPEVLNEYATYFQSLGFSGEEAIGMLVNIAPQGKIALDKLGDSLKELTIRATDLDDTAVQNMMTALGLNGQDVANNLLAGGDAANQQFDQIIDKLLGIQDPASQAAAAIALFGTPLEDLDKSKIPAFLASMDNAEASMQGFAGASQDMVDTVGSNAATSVESASRAIESGMAAMQTSLADAFGPSIEQIANFLVEHQDQITAFFTTAANAGAEFGSAVIGMTSGVIRAFGMVVQATGDLAGFVLDAFGGIVGGAASLADAVGMDGLAGDLRGAQDQIRGWSEQLHGAGDGMVDFAGELFNTSVELHNFDANLSATANSAWSAADAVDRLKNSTAGLVGQSLGAPIFPPAAAPSSSRPTTPFVLPSSSSSSSSGGGSSSGGSVRKVGSDSGLLDHTIGVKDQLASQFTDINDIGGWRPPDSYNEHSSGRAIDVMIPDWSTPQGSAYGDQVTAEALRNPNVQYVLWKQTQFNSDGSSKPMEDRGNPTQNHFDHAHVYTWPEARGKHPSGTPQSVGAGTGGVSPGSPARPGTPSQAKSGMGGTGGAGTSDLMGGLDIPSSLGGFGESFGGAIGSAIDGQVSSALGVLGIPESPGWLKGISQFIGGISVSGPGGQSISGGSAGDALGGMGSMFGNAAPGTGAGMGGTPPPDGAAHGRGGQPGPSTVYNIRTATVEDAFMEARRKENELALARLSSR